jgi:hypothetical protein
MARELTAEEWSALSEDERQARRRAKHQRETEHATVNDVAEESLTVNLNGLVMVRGRGTATSQELASALNRFPQLAAMIRAAQTGDR